MITVTKVTMDYLEELIGIVKLPQFGWKLESDKRECIQKAYQLQISQEDTFETCLYNSGIVESDESAHIEVELFSLESCMKYYVRVKVWDNQGEISEWSKTVSFLTALCSNEWKAQFISAETKKDSDNSKGTYVRKEFTLQKQIKSAYVCATALGLYKLYINGQKVGRDELTPGWTSYHKHLLYQTYEVTDLLRSGNNAIGAMLGAGWYKGNMGFLGLRNNYGEQTAFLGQLLVTYEDGSSQMIFTDETWKGTDAPVLFAEIYDGEIYDANKEISGWNEAGLIEHDWINIEIVEYDKMVLIPQGGCKVAEIETMFPKRIFKTPQGDTVIDFGQNMTGWIHVKASGVAGDTIELNCFEVLDANGNVYLDNLRGAKQRMLYTFKEKEEIEYHPSFTFMGFQYAKITSYPESPKIENFTAYAVHSDMEKTGDFECSNENVNQLQHNIKWGMKGNFVDVPTDCPQRNERLGWTGDAQIFSRTASYLMNTYHFYKKWLRDVEADQTPEGGVAHVVPDILKDNAKDDWLLSKGSHSAAAWADVAVITPWVMYLTYGDKTILKTQYKSMKGWVDFMRTHAKDYIWNYKLQFGDWVALDAEEGSYFGATPNDLTCTAYFAYTTGLFVKVCNVLGKVDEELFYKELYEKIVDKYQKTFFDKDGNMIAQTQTAHIVSLYFGLTPDEYKANTIAGLKKLLDKENGHLVTGFVGTPYFCHALSENGCLNEAYDLLLKEDFPSWLYQVKMGATTIWEHWDGLKPDGTMWSPNMNSFNHYAYGAIGEWLYRVCAGIEIDTSNPGYKHIIFQPHIGGDLTYVNATYQSIYGEIKSYWSIDGKNVKLEFSVPVNTKATIYIDEVTEVIDADGAQFKEEDGKMVATIGSGHYIIIYARV
ncbi:MAG: family 78 glycoside hydrolase catalytic domain [Lachnotalea sp.]